MEESLTLNEITNVCKMWERLKNFVKMHYLSKTVGVLVMNLFNYHTMSLNRFFV